MSKTLIHLIGFPGSGKLTTAKELCKVIDAAIVSNNLFNNIILKIVKLRNAEVTVTYGKNFCSQRKYASNIRAVLHKIKALYIYK
ncbi:ATP-binding protein [Wolbachia endosymbiont of Litomosoides brasiliensis]|uniref:ATP-binding protein n=1 Tax=Wolbachia endosymbiont of Litomosoides brasiliensis TaxID=1812117 RepID=UPI001FE9F21E|nr:ATP-binding protein [Wolbachia endosymbiont of Litomosoides brasiliensis]